MHCFSYLYSVLFYEQFNDFKTVNIVKYCKYSLITVDCESHINSVTNLKFLENALEYIKKKIYFLNGAII